MSKMQAAPSKVHAGITAISEKQRQGRAANAVAELLMRKLLVPKTFLEKQMLIFSGESNQKLRTMNVIAIDRAGSGDIHIVEIKLLSERSAKRILVKSIKYLFDVVPANFKYLAVDRDSLGFVSSQQLFAEDGIGRIGIIEIIESSSAPPEARIAIPAERFRVTPAEIKKFDDFQKKTPADMEIRD